MQSDRPISTDIVLLGAGHAHVEVLRRFAGRPEPGVRLTIIGREPHTPYSGMLPGLIRGDYDFDTAHIDLAPLAAASRARLIIDEALGLDLVLRNLTMRDHPPVPFDLLSVDTGGEPAVPPGAGTSVKPIGRFLAKLDEAQARLASGSRIAVVGAGPAGTELALAMARRFGERFRIILISAAPAPLPDAPARVRDTVRSALVEAGVELVCSAAAQGLANGRLSLSDGSFVEADTVLWATPVTGPGFLAAAGLACDDAGCVRVDRTLRSVSHGFVFAAGDCARIEGAERPKAGVWAVRAGAPLARNLRRAARKSSPRVWHPQRQALVIMGLGGGKAVAWRNGISVSGKWVWRWKDHIDRRWMRMFQMRMKTGGSDPMRCGGCGSKLESQPLADVLAELPRQPAPGVLIGLSALDDAAVIRPPPGQAVVQSVDYFRTFLDDPFVFGEIAATHALSDIYAMGARPWTALAIPVVRYAGARQMQADLLMMMRGAERVLSAEDCLLVGGHSAEGIEAALGFAVNGLVDPYRAWRKSGLHPGDALVLTKPIGTGVLLAGNMRGLTKARWLVAAISAMRRSNADAARILAAARISACTDVSGFGLAGHLMEMLRASGVAATLTVSNIPVLPGALELARLGVESSIASGNRRALQTAHERGVLPDLLIDPQTSGGLLAGVPADRVEGSVAAMREAGLNPAVIGFVRRPSQEVPAIVLE